MLKIGPFDIEIEQDEDGVTIVSAPALQDCHSYGYDREEALQNIAKAIQLCLRMEPINTKNTGKIARTTFLTSPYFSPLSFRPTL